MKLRQIKKIYSYENYYKGITVKLKEVIEMIINTFINTYLFILMMTLLTK